MAPVERGLFNYVALARAWIGSETGLVAERAATMAAWRQAVVQSSCHHHRDFSHPWILQGYVAAYRGDRAAVRTHWTAEKRRRRVEGYAVCTARAAEISRKLGVDGDAAQIGW